MMALIIAAVIAIATTLLGGLASDELYACLPHLTKWILRLAVRRVRDHLLRERLEEEWTATLADLPGQVWPLVHAGSLLISARRVERGWESERPVFADTQTLQVFTELVTEKLDHLTGKLRAGRKARNLSLKDLSLITFIPVRTLQAIEEGRFSDVPVGIFVRSYLRQIAEAVGLKEDIALEHWKLLHEYDEQNFVPPPSSALTNDRASRSSRLSCRLLDHDARAKYVHAGLDRRFHWMYYECERCGKVTGLTPGICGGRETRRKRDINSPLERVFTCQDGWQPPPPPDCRWRHVTWQRD